MNNKSSHILTTSSNLLGFAFLVLTSLKSFGVGQGTIIDELVELLIVLFSASSILSFVSIRIKSETRSLKYEKIADNLFFVGLFIMMLLAIFLGFDIITFGK